MQSLAFIRMLQGRGYQVFNCPNCQFEGMPAMIWEGIPILPAGTERWGWEGVLHYANAMKPHAIFTLMDAWALPLKMGNVIRKSGSRWYPIAPVDHDPIPERVASRLRHAETPIAFSQFGFEQMKNVGLKPYYIPHGVDTGVYVPKTKDKTMVGLDKSDNFVVGMVGTNVGEWDRKGFQQCLSAFDIFHRKHPDTTLFMWTIPDRAFGGIDIVEMAKGIISDEKSLIFGDKWTVMEGLPTQRMAELYNAFDVFFLPTRGEGFGVPLMEAQACGVPVVTTAFSATTELIGAGWGVPPKDLMWTLLDSYQAWPDAEGLSNALEEAYFVYKKDEMGPLQKKAREFALQYDFRTVFEKYFVPFLEMIDVKKTKDRHDRRRRHAKPEQGAGVPDPAEQPAQSVGD